MGSTPIPFRQLFVSRRKRTKYDPATQARRMARAVLGRPPAGRVIPSKKKKPPKHKRRELERELES
ncbi:MAG: hypothetical protein ACE5H2_00460 [Terriglobia bacterium]